MSNLKSKFDIIVDDLKKEGKVEHIDDEKIEKVLKQVEEDLEEYRFENQKRIKDSQEEIATVVLTA